MALFSPVSWAMRAREREPESRRWRRTSPRLLRRTVAWSAGVCRRAGRGVERRALVGHATPRRSDYLSDSRQQIISAPTLGQGRTACDERNA